MVTIQDVIKLDVDESLIKEAIKQSLSNNFLDNLRNRHLNVQLDCKIRGYIGEKSLLKFFNGHKIYFDKTNYISDDMGNIDIDLLYKGKYSLEIKTSLVPDRYVNLYDSPIQRIKKCIENFDIKLIKRNNNIKKLKGDIHIQIYYSHLRQKKDNFLSRINIDIQNSDVDTIYNRFKADRYINSTYFVAWINKETLFQNNPSTWSFPNSQRKFWTCKITNSLKPMDIIAYLKSLQ